MRTLLTTLNAKYIHTNLAVRILYGLNRHREGLDWKEFTIKENQDEVAAYCSNYGLVAFSCYIWNITQTIQVVKKIKALNPDTKILLGGPEVSYEFDDVISKPEIDFIISGEGEISFTQFLEHFPLVEEVPGLVFKKDGAVIKNKVAPNFDVKNFDGFMPYAFDQPETLRNKVLYIETSRGCPYKCEFCLASLDNKVRYLPDSNIKSTLLFLMQHGKVIKFLDRTFNIKRDFTIDIFKFILANKRPENVFQFEITADILHPDIIQFIHDEVPQGLFRFEIGIQTVNQKANLEVSRKQNFEKTKNIIKELDYKVEMHLDLIVGLPLDYWADIKYSFEEVFKLYAPEVQLGFLKFLKGTTMRDKEKHGFKYDSVAPYQIIESNYLSARELERITKLEHALELYWNNKQATNTLRYVCQTYSIFDFLLGLGEHFETRKDFHQFSLKDMFDILSEYAAATYPDDKILGELIAIDYYLHFKVRPQILYLAEVEKDKKNQVLVARNYNPSYRQVALPISFDFEQFNRNNQVIHKTDVAVIEYTGTTAARAIFEVADIVATG